MKNSFSSKEIEEIKILQFWAKYLLPRVGIYLNELVITECKTLNNNLVINEL